MEQRQTEDSKYGLLEEKTEGKSEIGKDEGRKEGKKKENQEVRRTEG